MANTVAAASHPVTDDISHRELPGRPLPGWGRSTHPAPEKPCHIKPSRHPPHQGPSPDIARRGATNSTVSQRMNRLRHLLIFATAVLLCSCSRGLPPLRTWEAPQTIAGAEHIEFSFTAPIRDSSKDYWAYRLGIILPAGTTFDLKGQVTVYSKAGDPVKNFRFESATESSWLRDPGKTSHLLADGSKDYFNDLGIEDCKVYRVRIDFDRPLTTDTGIALHFLSHTNPPSQIIR